MIGALAMCGAVGCRSPIKKKDKDGPLPSGSMDRCKSPYGVFDMSGNLEEWVQDFYDSKYYKNSPSMNPKGPVNGSKRVLRGGSFVDFGMKTKCAYRKDREPNYKSIRTGFRCCKDIFND